MSQTEVIPAAGDWEQPEGTWKLVPVEPTEAMAVSGMDEMNAHLGPGSVILRDPVFFWRAMLAAAPSPPAVPQEEVERLTRERDKWADHSLNMEIQRSAAINALDALRSSSTAQAEAMKLAAAQKADDFGNPWIAVAIRALPIPATQEGGSDV